jgi:hypothetical protein
MPGAATRLALPGPTFAPKAKRVIYMHMEGAPSQLDLWDYKPGLRARFDEELPDSIRQGQRLTGMTSGQTRFPSRRRSSSSRATAIARTASGSAS